MINKDKRLEITLTIKNRPYKLTIDRSEEAAFRKAATLINEKVYQYGKKYENLNTTDEVTMAAIDLVSESILNGTLRFELLEMEQRLSETIDKVTHYLKK